MKNTLGNVLVFAVGAAIGSAVTYYFVRSRYEKEIASLVEDFSQHRYAGPQYKEETEPVDEDDIPEDEEDHLVYNERGEYANVVRKLGYHNYSDFDSIQAKPTSNDIPEAGNGPRVITPEEFGTEDYKIVELSYWADGVVTDNKNKRIQDVDGLIGKGTLDRFGEHEEDALHVRDDEKKIDFEILRDLKRYSDFFGDDSPHSAEDE